MAGTSQPDTEILRNSLTREVTNDAYAISNQVFKQPDGDIARVSNDQIDERYHQAILNGDRPYLMQEAGRDPAQFMESMNRLIASGKAVMPPDKPVPTDPPLPRDARSNAPIPKPPEGAVQPMFQSPQEVPPSTAPAVPTPPPSVTPSPMGAPVPMPPPAPPSLGGGMTIPPPAQPPY
jgi:hypothetical protein